MAPPPDPRRNYSSLSVERDRGLIWVCDISKSSSYINNDDLAEDFEAFLPRLHWASSLAIDSVGGEFIQWTGDGFIAWFPLTVERDLGRVANRILEAAWHFSAYVNSTQLCVETPKPFRIRHGLTYEPDALVTRTTHHDGHVSKIVSGRNVVLAFRLSGVEADFPNVATQLRVVQALSARTKTLANLKRWTLSDEQVLRYFKGEKVGTATLFVSGTVKKGQSRSDTWTTKAEALLRKAEGGRRRAAVESAFVDNFFPHLDRSHDHDWCKESLAAYTAFARDGMGGSLNTVLGALTRTAAAAETAGPAAPAE